MVLFKPADILNKGDNLMAKAGWEVNEVPLRKQSKPTKSNSTGRSCPNHRNNLGQPL